MKCLVTAGNTQVMLDQVRCITNIFSGKTGTRIALELQKRGHEVVLLTSTPDRLDTTASHGNPGSSITVKTYRTYDQLASLMKSEITNRSFHAVIHSAAVSDFLAGGIYTPQKGSSFSEKQLQWEAEAGKPQMRDVAAGKVKSHHGELWVRLVKAPKLIDLIRQPWNFQGKLVKFKLEVGVSQHELQSIAEASRLQSKADWIIANTLEGMHDWALLGPLNNSYQKVTRSDLSSRLVDCLELSES